MSDIDIRALFRVRERIVRYRARSGHEKFDVTWRLGLALTIFVVVGGLRALLIVIYSPFAIVARLLNLRFPYSHAIAGNFGHLATDPRLYLKAQAVGVRPRGKPVLVLSRNNVRNRFMLEQWRHKFHLISNPILAFLLAPLKWSTLTGSPMYLSRYEIYSEEGELLRDGPAVDEIERRFESVNKGKPLLIMDEDTRRRGRRVLTELGVPEDAWWVALHVRESSYHGGFGASRNADPMSYLEAAQLIVDRGGYVIRIGDEGMTPLPPMKGIVDYALSPHKSDWMDIFLIGCARFLYDSNSGPASVAQVYGVPVAAANWVPMCQGLFPEQDIRIPKLIAKESPPVVMSFNQVLGSSNLRDAHSIDEIQKVDAIWVDNTADEIRELAAEMLDRLDGIYESEPLDEELQKRFHGLIMTKRTPETWGIMSRMGAHFLRTHADLFEDDPDSSRDTV